MAKVSDFLPKKELKQEVCAVQGYVPAQLRKQVLDQMRSDKANGIKTTWDNLLEGLLRSYLDERKTKATR